MIYNFKLSRLPNKEFKVIGLEQLNDYANEDEFYYVENKKFTIENNKIHNFYTFTDLTTMNILYKVDEEHRHYLKQIAINEHELKSGIPVEDSTVMRFYGDGVYRIIHVLLPTFDYVIEYNNYAESNNYSYYSGLTLLGDTLYSLNGEKITSRNINPTNLNEVDFTDVQQLMEKLNEHEMKNDVYTFSYENLLECLHKRNVALLGKFCNGGTMNCNSGYSDKYIRDIIWIGVNAIKYLLETGSYFEALRLLKKIQGCNKVCPEIDSDGGADNGCGCHK